jgi:serpin B
MTLLQMYTTLYFKARWQDVFHPERTEAGLFHVYDADGASVACDFMHRSSRGGYRRGDGYTASVLPFAAGGGCMAFCLPDSDTNVDELLRRDTLVSELREMTDYGAMVHWTVPKFDVRSTIGLNDVLQELGVTDAFGEQADFTPLTDHPAFLDRVRQSARVKIDEEGVEAAAFTEMAVCGMSLPHEEIHMTLDRPFIFAIYSDDGLPLFVGTVFNP